MRSLSWRVKLSGLFVLVLGASLLFQVFYVIPHIRNDAIQTTEIHQEEIASNLARELATDLNQTRDRVIELSTRPEFHSMDLAGIRDIMKVLAQGSYRFESLFVINADGWFIEGSTDDLSMYTTKSYADQPYFSIPFEKGEIYYGYPQFYAETGLVGTTVAVPIESNTGEPAGVLLAVFKLNYLVDLVTNYPLDEETVVYVVDTEGTVVAHSAIDLFALEDGPLSLDYSDWPMVQAVLAGQEGNSQQYEQDGTSYFGAYATLDTNGWGVVVERSMSAILAESSALTRWTLIVISILFVGSLGITLVFGQQIMGAQRHSEEALKLSEEKFRAIFDYASDGILIAGAEDKRFFAGNTAICEMLGYTPQEITTLGVADIHPEESLPDVTKQFEKQLRGEIALASDTPVKRKDGNVFFADVHASSVTLGEKTYLLGIFRDITTRKQAEEALRQSSQKIERLHQIAHDLEACEEEDQVYRLTVEAAEQTLSFSTCTLDIVEEDRLVVKATSSALPPGASQEIKLKEGGLAAKTYRTKETTVFGRIEDVPDATPVREDIRSGISAPIGDIGVFQAVSTEPDAFTKNDARMIDLLLGHTYEAIRRIRLQEDLKDQAIHDPLTGAYNRRYFDETIETELQRSKRYDHPISFLMIDIDRFKEINDTFGHQMGDKVLQAVAELLSDQVRENDLVIRYGGDEFLIVLIETNGELQMITKRIQQAVAKRNKENPLLDFPVTLSIGAAHWEPKSDLTIEQVLAKADQRMYEEKRQKSNQ